jgi:transcriptional regulator with XRE-family HTH domain
MICKYRSRSKFPIMDGMWRMSTEPSWAAMPAVAQATRSNDYGTLLRIARTAAGLTLEEAGERAGYSASTMSRLENRGRRAWDVKELRHLASTFGIPPHLFGLSRSTGDTTTANLSTDVDEGGDAMRRRELLAAAAVIATGATLVPTAPAAAADGMADTVEDVIFGRLTAPPILGQQLAAQIAAARADFRATRYAQLANRLPGLLARATASRDAAPTDQIGLAHARLAQAYNVATELLIKLHDNGMAWATADRAVHAAKTSGHPLVLAESHRLAATVMRRSQHRHGAQKLMLHTADQLNAATGLASAAETAIYARLLAAASYTAAMRDDRDTAWTLLSEAEDTARRLSPTAGDQFNMLDLAVYKISVSRVLGDYGSAVDYARLVDPARIASPERRARYWEDSALALNGRGRPTAAYHALLAAERDTPQEVRFRPWAQQLTQRLMAAATQNRLAGIREFAQRVGAA